MPRDAPTGPDLAGVIADAAAAGLEHVVIGGFSVIYHGYIRATRDTDLLVPEGSRVDEAIMRFVELSDGRRLSDGKRLCDEDVAEAEHLRLATRHGLVDILRGGVPPLDYETVAEKALKIDWQGLPATVASLESVVGFKRLGGRGQDRVDLENLELIVGELPTEPIPGLDE